MILESKEITLTDFTNSELDYLAEMIHEKLQESEYEPHDGNFSFDVIVHFEEIIEWVNTLIQQNINDQSKERTL